MEASSNLSRIHSCNAKSLRARSRGVTALVVAFFFTIFAASHAWPAAGQGLWHADSIGPTVEELTPSQRAQSGSPIPTSITGPDLSAVTGLAFDKGKNLWVTTFDNLLIEYTKEQLGQLGSNSNPTPAVKITSSTFKYLDGCTFDKHGNLWIVDALAEGVREISKKQLKMGSGEITPVVSITGGLNFPNFATFDKKGNLWVSSEDNGLIAEFSTDQLKRSGDKTPRVSLTDNGGSIDTPGGIQFDAKGNLWAANYLSDTVVEFAKADLAVSGSPTPAVTLTSTTVMGQPSLDGAWTLAFDAPGNLWVYNYKSGSISEFTGAQIAASGSPVPVVFLQGLTEQGYQLTFGPVY